MEETHVSRSSASSAALEFLLPKRDSILDWSWVGSFPKSWRSLRRSKHCCPTLSSRWSWEEKRRSTSSHSLDQEKGPRLDWAPAR